MTARLSDGAAARAWAAPDASAGPRPDVVVLDLDGTVALLDVPWEDVKRSLVGIAAAHGLDTSGHRRVLALLAAARLSGRADAVAELEAELERRELDGARRCLVNGDVVEWVMSLPRAIPVAVLSLNAPSAVAVALERAGMDRRVTRVLGRGAVRAKPDPEGLDLLIGAHGARPERMLFVGDSDVDRQCAALAGVPYLDVGEIGVTWVDPDAAA
jgi:phosphoglycolate phosphatase-like HAD superfamily hydrolase